jgi:hypothetical protein
MKILGPIFREQVPLYGMRVAWITDIGGLKFNEISPILFGRIKPETLLILDDPTEVLTTLPMDQIIKLGGSKGMRFAHFVRDGIFPEWLEYLDHTIIQIDQPKRFTQADEFNEAIQRMWFGRGKLIIQIFVRTMEDLDMTQLLYSYTPNDLEFWISLRSTTVGELQKLGDIFLSRRFPTVLLDTLD